MEWTDTALVLHVGRFREADLWVRLLALEQGLVTAFAFGGSRSRRRFTGCLDVFNVIRARVTASRDGQFLNMQESTLLEGPERLRRDWRRQGMAANCVRFMEALGVPPDASPFSFSLLRELLGLLENEERPPELAPLCWQTNPDAFWLSDGFIRESICSRGGGAGMLPRLPSARRDESRAGAGIT